jgi:hypothetical protein
MKTLSLLILLYLIFLFEIVITITTSKYIYTIRYNGLLWVIIQDESFIEVIRQSKSANKYFVNHYLKRITNTVDEPEIGYKMLDNVHTDYDAKHTANLLNYELILY